MTDAVEALDEHHDGRDAGAGDFGGIVEWAGGEAMWLGADFGNRFVAESDEIVVKKDRLDLPEALPRIEMIVLPDPSAHTSLPWGTAW